MKKIANYKIDIDIEIEDKGKTFEVRLSSPELKDVISVMPARSLDEATQVAMSSASGFAQFILGQKFLSVAH